jgi:predicted transcriptional regulator
MRKKTTDPLTPAEWNIMKIVWELGNAGSREIHEIAKIRHDWAVTTVKTILGNLVDKKILKARIDGNKFIYSPAKPAFKLLAQAADALMARSVDSVKGQLLCYMAGKIHLSKDDIDELQALIDEQKEKEERS